VRTLSQNLRSGRRWIIRATLLVAAAAALTGVPTVAADPMIDNLTDRNRLWKIVHDRCQLGYQRTGTYAPCTLVDENAGIALYKVDYDPNHYMLVPLDPVTGVEDPALQEPTIHNYLQDTWAARILVTSGLNNRLSESDIILAINPQNVRYQDQLHIHIACASPTAAAALKMVDAAEYRRWKPLPMQLDGQTYQALAVTADTLKSKNLFQDVYAKVIGDDRKMEHAVVAVANVAPDQFLLLVAEGTENRPMRADGLHDHNCSLANAG
jgi:CDP-diacylglycerol pyrophosphatase